MDIFSIPFLLAANDTEINVDFLIYASSYIVIGLLYVLLFNGLRWLFNENTTNKLQSFSFDKWIDNENTTRALDFILLAIPRSLLRNTFLQTFILILASITLGFLIPYWVFTSDVSQSVYEFVGLSDVIEFNNPEAKFVQMIAKGGSYALFALGYGMVFSVLGLLNLAHSAVYMAGALGALYFVDKNADVSMWYVLPAAMIAGGIISVLVDWLAFLPLRIRKSPRTAQLISSIGVAIIIINLANIFILLEFNTSRQRFPPEKIEEVVYFQRTSLKDFTELDLFGAYTVQVEPLEILGWQAWEEMPFTVRPIQFTIFITAIILTFLLQFLVNNTKIGKAMRVVAYDQKTAKLLGVNVAMIYSFTFFLAGGLAGAAGVLEGIFSTVDPFMGGSVALVGLTVIVLGGLGNIQASVVGAFLVANLEIVAGSTKLAYNITTYGWLEEAIVFFALFVTLLLRPQGMLGEPVSDRA